MIKAEKHTISFSTRVHALGSSLRRDWLLYAMLILLLAYYIIFK